MLYFDNSATTPVSPEALASYQAVTESFFANPSSIHGLGKKSQNLLQEARRSIAQILGVQSQEVYFAGSGTDVNNWIFEAVVPALHQIHPDKNLVLMSQVEHPSVKRCSQWLEAQGYEVEYLPVDDQGVIDLQALEEALTDQVLLVSTMAVNNEVGAVQPLEAIADRLGDRPGIAWHVDGIQAVTCQLDHLNLDRIDLLTLSSHKFHSVRGVGILVKRERIASDPYVYGGGQEAGLRSGTENLPAIVATAKALRLAKEGQEQAYTRLSQQRQALVQAFQDQGWEVFSQEKGSPHILCVALAPIPGEVLVNAFEEHEIYVSTTSACSSRREASHATLLAMGVDPEVANSAIRISSSAWTTDQEVDQLIQALSKVTKTFAKVQGGY